jgi:hypothetical protein
MLNYVLNVKRDTSLTKEFAINVFLIVYCVMIKKFVKFVIVIHIWITQLDYV